MGIYFSGNEYNEIHVSGNELTRLQAGGQTYHTKSRPDTPGALNVTAVRRRNGATIDYLVTDVNGIRSLTSVIMRASDGTVSNVTSATARTDANTFAGTSVRANNKWRNASITITYVDARSGASHTLTQNWSI